MAAQHTVLLDNRRQARKVRAVFWALLAAAALALWAGWSILETYGTSAADGGVLKPLWQRSLLGGFVAALGLAAAGGMAFYITLYAMRIEVRGETVAIATMTPFGRRHREYAISQIGESAYHNGRMHHIARWGARGGLWVNAPWITLRVAGRRLPFIIDLQSDAVDIGALSALAEGGVSDWQQDRG